MKAQKAPAKGARTRFNDCMLQGWDEVDQHLEQLVDVERQVAELEAQANEQIDQIKRSLAEHAEPLLATKQKLQMEVEQYLVANKGEFKAVRSRELNFGVVGFRLSSKIAFAAKAKVATVLDLLRKQGLTGCIITKEQPDKKALAKLDDETLAKVACKRTVEDTPWIELKRVSAAEAAAAP